MLRLNLDRWLKREAFDSVCVWPAAYSVRQERSREGFHASEHRRYLGNGRRWRICRLSTSLGTKRKDLARSRFRLFLMYLMGNVDLKYWLWWWETDFCRGSPERLICSANCGPYAGFMEQFFNLGKISGLCGFIEQCPRTQFAFDQVCCTKRSGGAPKQEFILSLLFEFQNF